MIRIIYIDLAYVIFRGSFAFKNFRYLAAEISRCFPNILEIPYKKKAQ